MSCDCKPMTRRKRKTGKTLARDFVKCIKQKMREHDMSAGELSRRARLGITAVAVILSGRNTNPTLRTMQAIAAAVDCELYELIQPHD